MRRLFMVKSALVAAGVLVICTGMLLGQSAGQRGAPGAANPAAGAQRGRGGAGGGAADRNTTGFGTTNTLTTIPESGQGSAADDPTPEQLAASPEAQAIIANAKKIAGTDLAQDVAKFCTWNGAADVPPRNPAFGTVQVFDNLYYSGRSEER